MAKAQPVGSVLAQEEKKLLRSLPYQAMQNQGVVDKLHGESSDQSEEEEERPGFCGWFLVETSNKRNGDAMSTPKHPTKS